VRGAGPNATAHQAAFVALSNALKNKTLKANPLTVGSPTIPMR